MKYSIEILRGARIYIYMYDTLKLTIIRIEFQRLI